jgi:hypothetical protein
MVMVAMPVVLEVAEIAAVYCVPRPPTFGVSVQVTEPTGTVPLVIAAVTVEDSVTVAP